ncbi:MAG: hypothetical protein PVH40_00035 [Gemmatimonadales bacterium]
MSERPALPLPILALIGLAVVVVVAIVAYNAGRSAAAGPGSTSPSSAMTSAGGGPPDISSMSPREQADRLFEIVMTAHEQGDFGRVDQFASMALQAYDLLGELDEDAHYHVGLMSAITGDVEEARARVDSMRSTVPNHLLATMLRATVAQMEGDTAAAQAAERKFTRDYEAEIATNRIEYQLHERAIENFRARIAAGEGDD